MAEGAALGFAGGVQAVRGLYVVQYPDDGAALQFKEQIEADGGSNLHFLGDSEVLVRATEDSILTATARPGFKVALYSPDLKLSPGTIAVAKSMEAVARHRRRRQLLDAGQGPGEPSSALDGLKTWSHYSVAFGRIEEASNIGASASGDSSGGFGDDASVSATGQLSPSLSAADGIELYGISVGLVSDLADDEVADIASAWPGRLAAALGRSGTGNPCQPRVNMESSSQLALFVCPEDFKMALTWLTAVDTVVWIDPAYEATTTNAVAGWIAQTGNITPDQYLAPSTTLRPYWAANLQGQGSIVGQDDTGVDLSHCLFLDDSIRPGSLRGFFTGTPPRLYLPNHRKVVQYVLHSQGGINAWFGDEYGGHGTHTAGTIAGSAVNSSGAIINEISTGSAPRARLSVFDMAKGGLGGRLYIPGAFDLNVLSYHHAVGARIGSDSWAYASGPNIAYLEICRQYDAFAWRNPDFLSVISAGNKGYNGMMATVFAPATAKNVLAVGATVNQPAGDAYYSQNEAFFFQWRDVFGSHRSYGVWPWLGSSDLNWQETIGKNKSVPVRLASPLGACSALVGNYTRSVVLVDARNGTCSWNTRATNVANANGVAVLFMVSDDLLVDDSGRSRSYFVSINLLNGLISRAIGQNMTAVLNDTRNTDVNWVYQQYPDVDLGIDSVAFFSATGPMTDGRFKPDIVAPGAGLTSAYAEGMGASNPDATYAQCSSSTTTLMGTSMAAALTSGHLALVRQYFSDGYYPTGTPTAPNSAAFDPSGMLLKALVIAGAKSLKGGFASNVGYRLGASPDGVQGWGRLDLSGALPLPGLTHTMFRLQVADMGTITQNQSFYLTGVRATGTGPIFAALVWHDYPSSSAQVKHLVNDLDLGYLVNQGNSANVSRTRQDNSNNVERAELTGLRSGDRVTFVVTGRTIRHHLLSGPDTQLPQRWALAVVGHFTGILKTPLNPAFVQPQRVLDKNINLVLPNGLCIGSVNNTLVSVAATSCSQPVSILTLVQSTAGNAASYGKYVYSIHDTAGRCLAQDSTFAVCNTTATSQMFAFFRNPYMNGSFFHVVPVLFLGVTGTDRRCLRQTAAGANAKIALVWCNEDDQWQRFQLRRPPTVPVTPPLPPSPAPPSPSPDAPLQQWYPYPLTFRTDWWAIGGNPNPNDYDYGDESDTAAIPDYRLSESPYELVSNLDILVAWTWKGVKYLVGPGNIRVNATAGAVYGGNNIYSNVEFETVHFHRGVTPPATIFYVCVFWNVTEAPKMNVTLTVFKGYPVARISKVVDTTKTPQRWCNTSSPGYIGSYNLNAPAPPPRPPATPAPLVWRPEPLFFRVDWVVLSGMRGRGGIAVNLGLILAWQSEDGYQVTLSREFSPAAGGAFLGPDNMDNRTAYEVAYFPTGSTPPRSTYAVCLSWDNGNKQPRVQVTLSVYRGGLVMTSTKVIDTTQPFFDYSCSATSLGFIDNYYYAPVDLATPPPQLPPCTDPPLPSNLLGLYFIARWTPVGAGTGGSNKVYDWDLVVSWTAAGQSYELSRNSRFVGGGVHGGDNVVTATKANAEVAFWPTGITQARPAATKYCVCVRWHQAAGAMNVTLTVYRGTAIVRTLWATWNSSMLYSKACSPTAIGFVGSYQYDGSGIPGRRLASGQAALEMPTDGLPGVTSVP